jgi:hypothetical protein
MVLIARGAHGDPEEEEELMKARMFRLALSLSTLAMLVEVAGAGKKWG